MKDITENKHGGNANSTAAFETIENQLKPRQREVHSCIFWSNGVTCKEIADTLATGMNAISGRLTELKAMGKIKVVGRRDGCAIYEINES
jgi:predicted transcriptional regulator